MSGETAERGLDLLLLDGLRCVETTRFRQGLHKHGMRNCLVRRRLLAAWPREPRALWSLTQTERGGIESSPMRGTLSKTGSGGFWHGLRQLLEVLGRFPEES